MLGRIFSENRIAPKIILWHCLCGRQHRLDIIFCVHQFPHFVALQHSCKKCIQYAWNGGRRVSIYYPILLYSPVVPSPPPTPPPPPDDILRPLSYSVETWPDPETGLVATTSSGGALCVTALYTHTALPSEDVKWQYLKSETMLKLVTNPKGKKKKKNIKKNVDQSMQ